MPKLHLEGQWCQHKKTDLRTWTMLEPFFLCILGFIVFNYEKP